MISDKILAYATTQIGVKEKPLGSNCVKYNTEYYGNEVSGDGYPWCAVFIWACFKHTGLAKLIKDVKNPALCQSWVQWARERKIWKKTPQVGALVVFDWNKDNYADHIGIVTRLVDGTKIADIEGNSSNQVSRRSRKVDNVLGYIYIDKLKDTVKNYDIDVVAKDVINGKYGNGNARKKALKKAGYDYNIVQKRVNELLKG